MNVDAVGRIVNKTYHSLACIAIYFIIVTALSIEFAERCYVGEWKGIVTIVNFHCFSAFAAIRYLYGTLASFGRIKRKSEFCTLCALYFFLAKSGLISCHTCAFNCNRHVADQICALHGDSLSNGIAYVSISQEGIVLVNADSRRSGLRSVTTTTFTEEASIGLSNAKCAYIHFWTLVRSIRTLTKFETLQAITANWSTCSTYIKFCISFLRLIGKVGWINIEFYLVFTIARLYTILYDYKLGSVECKSSFC